MAHSMSMSMIFTNSHRTPLYSESWTPSSDGAYAGLCIFLILLAITLRLLFAGRAVLEQRWAVKARNRRYVVVRGQQPASERIEQNPDAKEGSLRTAQGVEERVKVVQASHQTIPFRLSVDVPRALVVMTIAAVAYLLMLAVMTMNVGYFMSVLAGTFLGEVLCGRYSVMDEIH